MKHIFVNNIKKIIGKIIFVGLLLQSSNPFIALYAKTRQTHVPESQKISFQAKPPLNINNFIADSNLNKLIKYMVENNDINSNKDISDPLKRCYKTLLQGTQVLPIEDIWQAMPEILQYAVDYHTKAPRPNAPITESNAIVGPGGCDTAQLLELLVTIKNRIGCVSDDVCCNTILGILGDACEIFGGNDTISSILIKILELLETQTACCEQLLETLTILEVIERDVQNTFTVLEHIQETLEECCENIIEEIIETRSILIECCEKLDCLPTPLTQADVVGGIIELTEKGNYKFCEDITADLIISNSCISVDMNDRKLFGVVSIHGDDDILKNGFIQPPAPTSLLAAITRVDNGIAAAVSVEDCVVNVRLLNLTITNANSIGVDENNNGLPGRDGIFNNGIKTFILDCCIQTGAGSNGGNAQGAPNPLPAGNGGNGGNGIKSCKDKVQIGRTIIMTGGGGNGGTTEIGTPGLDNAGNGGSSGIGIIIFCPIVRQFNFMGNLARVFDSQVFTGSGGVAGLSCCGVGGNGGGSGDGIQNNSQFTEILNTTVRTGNAGSGGAGDSDANGGAGGNSGNAILTQGTQIINVLLSTGNAGNGGNGGIGGTGGSAGHGLFVLDACNTEAREIVVEFTGFGGNGGNSLLFATPGGAGGNGGDAVHITENSKHTEVRNSTFSNTGRGGTGGTGTPAGADGFPGRAVTDLNNDLCSLDPECETEFGPSAIFSNFAYAIGDNNIRYLINGKIKESGKASDKSCNRLDNVYVECNVDVVFDFCQGIEDLLECCTALSNQLEECCDAIRNDIFNTQTTILNAIDLANCCTTILAAIDDLELTNCCTTILADIFDSQTTILAAIDNLDIVNCCTAILDAIDDLGDQLGGVCTAISLHQSDFTSSTFVISVPGRYIFAEDITFSPILANQPAIEIQSDDVILDLCGRTLQQGNLVSGIDGIRIQGDTSSSPRSNVEVRNGTVRDFTRAGITVGTNSISPLDTACTRIRLEELDVVACQIRGIELLGTALAQITESILDTCNIIDCCKSASADFALHMIQCSSVFINRSSLYNDGSLLITNFKAVNVQNCLTCFLNNITVDFNTGQNFIGFNLDTCENCTFTSCIVSKCTATDALRGFEFIAGATNTKNIMRLCSVLDNAANNGPFIGFDLLVGVLFNQLVECIVANNSTVNAVATANCIGFNYDQVERCSTVQCRALRNLALADGTTNIAVGYNIISTGGAATGNVACEWVRSDAVGNTAATALRSFGIRATSTANGNRVNAYLGNVAYRNGPVGTAISTRQITADGGTDSFVGGVPFNSVRTVTGLNNFNGVNDQYSNIRIAD